MKSVNFNFHFKNFLYLFVVLLSTISGGRINAQLPGCIEELRTMNEKGSFFVRIYVHVIRKNDESGGQSLEDVEEALNFLDEAFNPHNIFFVRDCEIDYIDNSSLFSQIQLTDHNAFFSDSGNEPHEDGIDIYLFPDHPYPNTGYFGVASFNKTALYVVGNYHQSPYTSMVRSHNLSHEMGHCLGLLHTFHYTDFEGGSNPPEPVTGYELVDQSGANTGNCEITGDCLCDTPASPNLNHNVSPPPGCTWQESDDDRDDPPTPFVPSTTNIMEYTHVDCYAGFTDDQGKRMRNVIKYFDHIGKCLVEEVVEETTTWTVENQGNEVKIAGTLVIKEGVTLTIESGVTVRFWEKNKLIIGPGATLILKGTLSSNPCASSCSNSSYCGETWKGVEVWGNTSVSQHPEGGKRFQGRFIGVPGSRIENAELGIQTWGEDKSTTSGGIVLCSGTIFENNKVGVNIAPYSGFYPSSYPPLYAGKPTRYLADFSRCVFETNGDYPHDENFSAFIYMNKVKNPVISGCSFVVDGYSPPEAVFDFSAFGSGISATDAEFKVKGMCESNTYPCTAYTRNEFIGLGYGIYTGVSFGLAISPFVIKQSDFTDCYVGIHNRAITGGTILHNNFTLGNLSHPDLVDNQIGVALSGIITGMTLEENDFEQIAGNSNVRTIGISSFNIGTTNKVIRKNAFTRLNVGNEAGGSCGSQSMGLLYECNTNLGMTEYDFQVFVPEFSTGSRIKEDQFSTDISDPLLILATGNQFSNTAANDRRDFNNQGGHEIDYYYNSEEVELERPNDNFGLTALEPVQENACPESYCEPPCKTTTEVAQIEQDFHFEKNIYQALKEESKLALENGNMPLAEQKEKEAAIHRQIMDKHGYTVLIHHMYDTLDWNRDRIRDLLSEMDNFGTEMMLAFDYLGTNEIIAAGKVLNKVSTKFELSPEQELDLSAAETLYDLLSIQSQHKLDTDALNQIETIAEARHVFSSGVSKNILTLYGWHYPPISSGASKNKGGEKKTKKASFTAKPTISVFPNPAQNYVFFKTSSHFLSKPSHIQVMDITGKVVWQWSIEEGVDKVIWNTTTTANGIYFYQWMEAGQIMDSGKIIIQK